MCKSIAEELINIQTGEKLDWNKLNCLKDNSMLKVRPELWCEWDFEKGHELKLDIWKMTKGSHKTAWWICPKCTSKYHSGVSYRASNGVGCPYCAGQKVNYTNSLATINPELASEWHPTKNGDLTPNDVTERSGKKFWWLGKCGHEWEAVSYSRARDNLGCPYCTNQKTLIGFNDIHTTNPKMSKSLVNFEDGLKYTQGSNRRVEFKCPDCEHYIGKKSIVNIFSNGISCPRCSDGKSYPEKFVSNLLAKLGIEFNNDIGFSWSDSRRYDFYLPDYNMIIEVHGGQHYNGKFKTLRGRDKNTEEANDKMKKKLAIKNNIKHYFIIDARYSELDWIKKSILESDISRFFDLNSINWQDIHEKSLSSLVFIICKEYNSTNILTKQLAKKYGLDVGTIYSYLKKGKRIGITRYTHDKQKVPNICNAHQYRKIIRLSKDGEYLQEYNSIKDGLIDIGVSNIDSGTSCVGMCCRGKLQSSHGFKWMYKEDYEKLQEQQNNN